MANPHGTPIWYELQTPDAEAAKTFYADVVGWTIGAPPPGDMDYRMIQTKDGNVGRIAQTARTNPDTAHPARWLMYVGVDDVDAAAAAIGAAGGSVTMGPFDMPGVGRMAKAADPQGLPFYVLRGVHDDAQGDVFSPIHVGRTSWNELTTGDLDAAIAFYTGLFGWHVSGAMPMGAAGDYKFLSLGKIPLGAAMQRMTAERPAGWTFYFRVVDVDAAAAAIRAGGGIVHMGPIEVPGGDHVVMASDPQGAAFGVVGARGKTA